LHESSDAQDWDVQLADDPIADGAANVDRLGAYGETGHARIARGGRQQRGEHSYRGGLASPIGAEQGEDLTGVDRKGQTIDCRKGAEAASKALDFQNDFAHKDYESVARASPPASLAAPMKDDFGKFLTAFADRYFKTVRDAMRKYDPHHLYLGCRFAWRTTEAVNAAARHADVVSFNIYRSHVDPEEWGFTPSLNKPCIIGEFHFGAVDRGMFHTGLATTPNHQARDAMYKHYLESVEENPAFVGCHWFQYYDEPLTGRSYDGENYNSGFVSITDTPYPEMVEAAKAVASELYSRRMGSR